VIKLKLAGIMTHYRLIVWLIGFVPEELGLATLTLPIGRVLSMAIRTWLFFTRLAPLTAYTVRIGTFVSQ